MMTLANRLASLIILLLLSCSSPEKNLVTINGNTMGTTYTIKFFPKTNNPEEIEENYEPLNNDDDLNSNIDMPPQRDIRDTQPTISVNYRVIKNTDENNFTRSKNYSNSPDKMDDWNNDDNDW